MKKIIFLAQILWILIAGISWARTPGTSSASFLKINVGARPAGMGEAFTAVSDDINAINWNPAGLNFFEGKEVTFTHNSWFLGVNHEYFAYAQKLNALGLDGIGASLSMVNYGDIPRTIDNGGVYGGQDGTFSASSFCFTLSVAKIIKKEYNLGINFKVIQESIAQYGANAFAFDLGFLYNLPMIKGLTVGASLQNLGSAQKFIEEEFPLPQKFTVGVGAKTSLASFLTDYRTSGIQKTMMEKGEILISCDANFPFDYVPSLNIGVEYNYDKMIFARFGFKVGAPDNLSTFSFGAGFKWKNFTIDYAWVPYGNLGNSHRISFIAGFYPQALNKEAIEATRKAAEEARIKAEEEKKKKSEEEARLKMQEEEKKRLENEEIRRKSEEEATKKASEEARLKSEDEARKKAEEERQKVLEEECLEAEKAKYQAEIEKARFEKEKAEAEKAKLEAEKSKEVSVKETEKGLEISMTSNVFFVIGKSSLTPASSPILDKIIKIVKAYPKNKISIEGHTDSKGTRKNNITLSKKRAEAVANYFITKGIEKKRISIVGYGPDRPIASNATKRGKAENRRVEVIILK